MSEAASATSKGGDNMSGKVLRKCPDLASRFRGCMLGSLVGDCLGQPFEGEERPISKSVLNNYFEKMQDSTVKVPYKAYTDDTAMTFSVAQSLINKNRFDPQDMARKFVDEFYAHPRRGYGSSVTDVFRALKREDCKDPYGPEKMASIEKTYDQPATPSQPLIPGSQPRRPPLNMSYVWKLKEMRQLLKNPSVSAEKVVDVLGHFVSAYGSVCTAIYSFLRIAKEDGTFNESPVQRAIRYAISLGGDTDTIACMTGALAGAYYGHEAIPTVLLSHCEAEGVQRAIELADCLYQTVEK